MQRAVGATHEEEAVSDDEDGFAPGSAGASRMRCDVKGSLPMLFVILVMNFLLLAYSYDRFLAWSAGTAWIEVACFGVVFVLFFISYSRAACMESGKIPDTEEWVYGSSDKRLESKKTGERRYCKWCDKYKPDRGHHCRICKKCVLKMDHHCPWLHNCVGFRNHKYFLLLVTYGTLLSFFVGVRLLPRALDSSLSRDNNGVRMLFFVSATGTALLLGVSLFFFLAFHVWIFLSGMTTIEFCEKSSKKSFRSQYNLGCWKNMVHNFGPHWWLWWLPCSPPTGDGCHFEVDPEAVSFAKKPTAKITAKSVDV